MKKPTIPNWILEARNKWTYRGQKRPPFAIEPKAGQVSVWDFPRPPSVTLVDAVVRVFFEDTLLAKTDGCLAVKETANPPTYYIPPHDVDFDQLVEIDTTSWCEWKGKAGYWALKQSPKSPIAWDYPNPFDEYEQLTKYLAFYPHRLRCFIGDEQITPQDSTIYAGWITKDLVGPFKGQPGSENW
ncbi:DUF427 domain-containing protein [Maribacter flavus]|uniref:DUF427 domain-containing protein n=1 Tax=Maribacter flavus TaxID=1658664 RepID=UPI001FEA4EF8|nr:DUF427 domain-containing protein [Maribacter flavus]